MKSKKFQFKGITLIIFILMILVNVLANTLPINNVTTAEVANLYPILFSPANYTFVIWIPIYILLGLFTLYQLKINRSTALYTEQFIELRYYFCISSLANIVWIFAWHYLMIDVSCLVMLMILYCLVSSVSLIGKIQLSKTDKTFIKIPFEFYYGWILIATLSNILVFLESINWNGFGVSMEYWTIVFLILGILFASFAMVRFKSPYIGLAPIWAYIGILINHISPTGFDKEYPSIIIATVLCILALVIMEFLVVKRNRQK